MDVRWIVEKWRKRKSPVVPVIRLSGVIGGRSLGGQSMSAKSTSAMIEKAFSYKKASAVALLINSPGGSPTQTSLIARQIRREADKADIKVLAFVEDVAASGGYWLACAADEIFIDDSSIVGSIGVVSGGFGFTGAISKLGIERRLYTAGKSKAMLDPFSEEKSEDVARLKEIQGTIHDSFKDWVSTRRSDKLSTDEELFDGRVVVGKKAVEFGLVDGVGHLEDVIEERFGKDVRYRPIGQPKSLLPWRSEARLDNLIDALIGRIEAEALWQRYGL